MPLPAAKAATTSLAIDEPSTLVLPPKTDLDALYLIDDASGYSKARSLLMLAASYGATRCTEHVLRAGASPNLVAPDGMTALHCACSNAMTSQAAIAALLERGADPGMLDMDGRTLADLLAQTASMVGRHRQSIHART